AGDNAQRFLVGDGDDLVGAARHLDFGGAGRQHDGGEQVIAVGMLFEHAVQEVVQGLRVVLDALRHVELFFRTRIDGAARVLQYAFAYRAIGRVLVFGAHRGVDVDAARVQVVLVDAVEQLARQFGDIFAMHGIAACRRAFGGLDDDGLRLGLLVLGVGQVPQGVHAAQYVMLAQFGAGPVGDGVETRRRLGNAGQHRGLGGG